MSTSLTPSSTHVTCLSHAYLLQNGLSGYCENVWNSLATIDGRILPAEAMLSQSSQSSGPPHGGKRRKQKGEQPTPAAVQRYTVALFAQMVSNSDKGECVILLFRK